MAIMRYAIKFDIQILHFKIFEKGLRKSLDLKHFDYFLNFFFVTIKFILLIYEN